MPNKSVIVVQLSGTESIDVDTTMMKAKAWKILITDAKPEEAKKGDKKA